MLGVWRQRLPKCLNKILKNVRNETLGNLGISFVWNFPGPQEAYAVLPECSSSCVGVRQCVPPVACRRRKDGCSETPIPAPSHPRPREAAVQAHRDPACPFQTSRYCAPSRTRSPRSSGMPCGGCTPLSPPSASSPPRTTCTGTGWLALLPRRPLPWAQPTGACHAGCGHALAPASQPEMCPEQGTRAQL